MDYSGSTPEQSPSTPTHGQRVIQASTCQSVTPITTSSEPLTTRATASHSVRGDLNDEQPGTENGKEREVELMPTSTAALSQSGEWIVPSHTDMIFAN